MTHDLSDSLEMLNEDVGLDLYGDQEVTVKVINQIIKKFKKGDPLFDEIKYFWFYKTEEPGGGPNWQNGEIIESYDDYPFLVMETKSKLVIIDSKIFDIIDDKNSDYPFREKSITYEMGDTGNVFPLINSCTGDDLLELRINNFIECYCNNNYKKFR